MGYVFNPFTGRLDDVGNSNNISGESVDVQTFTSSGTWTKPAINAEIDRVEVEILNAGQGGGAGGTGGAGSPGTGGSYAIGVFAPETFSSTESVIIGAGGSGGIAGGAGSSSGGTTSFGVFINSGQSNGWSLSSVDPQTTVFDGAAGAYSDFFDASGNVASVNGLAGGLRLASGTGQTRAANGTNDSSGLIGYIGSVTGTTSADLTGLYQVGDLILAFAFRDGSTSPPTVPTGEGWNTIQSNGANTCSSISAWKIADTTNEATGTWTNATSLIVLIYRNCHASSPIGQISVLGGSGTAISFTGFDPNDSDHPWVVGFAGHRTGSGSYSAPTGLISTLRGNTSDATDTCTSYDSNTIVKVSVTTGLTFTGVSSGWQSQLIEIKRKAAVTPTNGSNGVNIGAGGGAGGSANRGNLQAGNGGNGGPGGGGGAGGSAKVHSTIGTGLPGNGGNGGDGWVRVTTYLK